MALDSLGGASKRWVSMTTLVECVARLLYHTQLVIHQLLKLLTHKQTSDVFTCNFQFNSIANLSSAVRQNQIRGTVVMRISIHYLSAYWPLDNAGLCLYSTNTHQALWWQISEMRPLPWPSNLARAMVMTHAHAKGQGQRSLGSKVRVETDGRRWLHFPPPCWRKSVNICDTFHSFTEFTATLDQHMLTHSTTLPISIQLA